MNKILRSIEQVAYLALFVFSIANAEKPGLIENSWSNNEIEIIEFNYLKARELGLDLHTKGYAWRKKGTNVFYPINDGGLSGLSTLGLQISKTIGCPFPDNCSTSKDSEESFEILKIQIDSTKPGVIRNIRDELATGTRLNGVDLDFSKPIKLNELRISHRGNAPLILSANNSTNLAKLEQDFLDHKIVLNDFLPRSRVLYFLGKTKNGRYSFSIDLPNPSREESQLEFIVKDHIKNKLHSFGSNDMQAVYANGDGNIYVRGRTEDGVNFQFYWPTNRHVARVKQLKEEGTLPSAEFVMATTAKPEGEVIKGPGKKPLHFLYDLGEESFFEIGAERYKENQIMELSDGANPNIMTAQTNGLFPERKAIYKLWGDELGLDWEKRFLGKGVHFGKAELECMEIVIKLSNKKPQ